MTKLSNSSRAAVIYEKGSPDVLRWEEIEVPNPKNKEVRLKNTAIGVNYIDTYHRRGMPHPWIVFNQWECLQHTGMPQEHQIL